MWDFEIYQSSEHLTPNTKRVRKKNSSPLPKMSKMVQKVLKAVYDDPCLSLKEATEVSAKDASHVNSCSGGQKAANYGEMCPDSWSEVLKELKCDENDVFFDLGSGRGVITIQASLEVPGMKCCGVELSRKRHSMAIAAQSRIKAISKRKGAPPMIATAAEAISFQCADMRSVDISSATLVYLMNQDLPAKLQRDILKMLHKIGEDRREARRKTGEPASHGQQPLRLLTLVRMRDAGPVERVFSANQTWMNGPGELFLYNMSNSAAAIDVTLAQPGMQLEEATGELRSIDWHTLMAEDTIDHTGKRIYRAGVKRCVDFLCQRSISEGLVHGRRVLELGCGLAIASHLTLILGAVRAVATDGVESTVQQARKASRKVPSVLQTLCAGAVQLDIPINIEVEYERLEWGSRPTGADSLLSNEEEYFDLIIGTELMYGATDVYALVATIAAFLDRKVQIGRTCACAILAHIFRSQKNPIDLVAACDEYGLDCIDVSWREKRQKVSENNDSVQVGAAIDDVFDMSHNASLQLLCWKGRVPSLLEKVPSEIAATARPLAQVLSDQERGYVSKEEKELLDIGNGDLDGDY